MHAAQHGKPEVVRTLLKHGAIVDARYDGLDQNNGRTALMFVTDSPDNQRSCAEELVAGGANINARDAFGQTALIFAVQAQPRTARYLLEHGADVNVRDHFGKPALTLAIEVGQFDTVRELLTKGADVNAVDHNFPVATLKNKTRTGLKEVQLAWNIKTNSSGTPLMVAVQTTNREVVELLIEAGADVNARDKQGLTPLKLATQTNHVEIIKILKAAGAKE
jgi:ankyrin repeat protein